MARRKDESRDLSGWSTLLVGIAVSGILLYKNGGWPAFRSGIPMGWEEYYVFNISLLLLPPFLLILWGQRRELSEFGLTAGDLRWGTIGALASWVAFLPVLWFSARASAFQDYYLWQMKSSRAVGYLPVGGEGIDWGRLAFHETVMCFYMLAWEWFFRGFLLFGLRRTFPAWVAVLIQASLFCLLHLGKPTIEVASSLVGGVILGAAALRFRSMLPCFLVHFLISASNDLAVLYFRFR